MFSHCTFSHTNISPSDSYDLHVSYIHPSTPYIPKSISIRWAPIQVTTRKIEGSHVTEGFVVPPNTKSVLLFMRQKFSHICADRSSRRRLTALCPVSM